MKIKSSKPKTPLEKRNLNYDPEDKIVVKSPVLNDTPDIPQMLDEVIEKKGSFFCSQPFVHMYVPTYGLAHPCCNTTMNVKKHVSEIGLDGIWNQPELKSLREEMANGNKERERTIKTCYRCIETEWRGFDTPRMAYNRDLSRDPEEQEECDRLVQWVIDNPGADYPIPEKIHTAQIKVWGNYCNLKCAMCSPEDSSSVGEEVMLLGEMSEQQILDRSEHRSGYKMPFKPPLIRYEDNNIDEDEFWDNIKRTKRIQLIGGETWLIKQNVQILERCVEEGWAKDKRIFAFSNNYGHPNMQKIADLLSQFQHVHYKCSMEHWGPKNDYIRFPSKWEVVEKNIKTIASIPGISLGFAVTSNPLSLGYSDDMVKGCMKYGNAPGFFNLTRPQWMAPHIIPDDIREFYLDKLYSNSWDIIEKIQKPIEYLEKREFNQDKLDEFVRRMSARDKLRNDSILNHFPEWTPYFIHDEYYQEKQEIIARG